MGRVPLAVAALVAAVTWYAWPRNPPLLTVTGPTMGTTYTVHLIEPAGDQTARETWQERIQACLDDVNAHMSTYRADSEVSRFNRATSTDWFAVSSDTALVVETALKVSQQTDGAFDVTVGPLVNLWSFGPDHRPLGIPSEREIEAARSLVGYQHLEARGTPPALRKQIPDLSIDLSAIAKGFAVDKVADLLESAEVAGYMVEVGGEVRTRGTKTDGTPWRIAIEQPVAGQRLLEGVLELNTVSLASSGDYRNFFSWEGELYCHQIDPRTGRPVRTGVAAVSVQHPSSAMWADAYATALMVMSPEQGWRLARQQQLDLMMILHTGGGYERRMSSGFRLQPLPN